MKLVVDASLVVAACLSEDGLDRFGKYELVSPPLMWSEARSALHELVWRREVPASVGDGARDALDVVPVRALAPARLGAEAWAIADELGWAKTYDAEYVALAGLLDCRLVTLDAGLHRSARRLGFVVSPLEI